MFDKGTGTPFLVIPGIQGRLEWMRPGLEALARHGRVLSYSLADEPTSGFAWRPGDGFDRYVSQAIEAMDRAGVGEATVCGVSYGGLVAAAVAARHPGRVRRLVVASALAPSWVPDDRVRRYLRWPLLMFPVFVVTSPIRMGPEIRAAFPGMANRVRFQLAQAWRVARAPMSPWRAARRVRMLEGLRLHDEACRITAPVLVLTGDEALDRVVPVETTREYQTLCGNTTVVTLERTGHIGIVTQPGRFAEIVARFARDDEDGATEDTEKILGKASVSVSSVAKNPKGRS